MSPRPRSRSFRRARPIWGTVLALALLAAGATGLSRLSTPPQTPGPSGTSKPDPAAGAQPQKVDPYIRIGLRRLSGRPSVEVKALTAARLVDGSGRRLATLKAGQKIKLIADIPSGGVLATGSGVRLTARDLTVSGGMLGIGTRRYPHKLHFLLGGAGLEMTNELEIEQYLEGVLPGELPRSFGIEAQKAQAVAARTYALVQRGKHGDFDLCDRTHCQMYVGMVRGTAKALLAVRSTRHQVLWHGQKLVYAFYSADCGGLSTKVEHVPIKDKPAEPLPYLTLVRDAPPQGPDYCATSPYHAWSRRFTQKEMEDRLNSEPETYVGKLTEVKVLKYDPSGRVDQVLLRGVQPALAQGAQLASNASPTGTPVEKQVHGWIFRRSVGPLALKSTLMTMDSPKPGVYRFQGSGFGHGLGLCQIGANGLARQGADYRQILAHYYPGTEVSVLER